MGQEILMNNTIGENKKWGKLIDANFFMGDTSNKFVSGLASDTITVSFLNDTAAANVLATLQTAFGTTVAFSAIQDATSPVTVSATNKLYTGTILVDNLTDINGAVGDEGMLDITFTCNSKTVVASSGTW